MTLPRPTRDRFQPLRSGLVNVYRYDDQEFWYEDGHLLLRGNNGTGKSRVLALQLPFLLDGEVAPNRMEPDGDPAKKAEWNLLMGGKHPDRLGYTWIELGRRAPELPEGEAYVTLGCGLQAAAGRGLVSRWFFVTQQRIGRQLSLVTAAGQALSRERLAEAIGDAGAVYKTAASYREAVDSALFRLGKSRYDALVTLLIQLRQPQLSRQLDEQRLSTALSEALPPLSAQLIGDVAEAFRALEADRAELDGFRAASRAVEQFLGEYRRYCQIATRRRAATVRTRHAAYERTMGKLRDADRRLAEAEAAQAGTREEIARGEIDERAATAEVEALAASPAMADAQALRGAREAADRAAAHEQRTAQDAERRTETRKRRDHEVVEAQGAAIAAGLDVGARGERLRTCAVAIGVEARHAAIAVRLEQDDVAAAEIERALDAIVAERRRALRLLRQLTEALRDADAASRRAEEGVRTLEGEAEAAVAAVRARAEAREVAARSLWDAYRAFAVATRELAFTEPGSLGDELAAWAENLVGASPVTAVVRRAHEAALGRLSLLRADVEGRRREVSERIEALVDERAQLESGVHHPPKPPPTRNEAQRAQRPGAPLWRLVDFVADLPPEHRGGLEAALEASGLLDAWVSPDGRLLDEGEHDVLLVARGERLAGPLCLGAVLRAALPPASPVQRSVVEELLVRIGLSERSQATAWVDTDGRFRVGPLEGRYAKARPEHVGEGAREEARQRRLQEIAVELGREQARAAALQDELAALDGRVAAAAAEAARGPDDQPVRDAVAALAAADQMLAGVRRKLADAQAHSLEQARVRETHRVARQQAAADLGLGAIEDLSGLEEGISGYAAAAAALGPALATRRAALRRHTEAAGWAADAADEETAAHERHQEARAEAASRRAERDVLEQSVGAAVEEILGRYAAAKARAARLREAVHALRERERDQHGATVAARAEGERERAQLAVDADARERAAASLVRLANMRLVAVAVPDPDLAGGPGPVDWSTTRAVEVARRIEGVLDRIDMSDVAWERSSKGLLGHVEALRQALLPYGHQATTTLDDELARVEVPFQGRLHTMGEFGEVLGAEVGSRQTLLSAREREVLENHLVGEVSMHIHDHLHTAERLVREMNDELAARPMSTGMVLRFSWRALEDGPPGLLEARKRLMRAGATWSPAERDALATFLQKRIADVRTARPAASWQDHLAEALDYRAWHSFGVERMQDGVWKPLTRRTHGTGSGGEKAVALTLPQFAAAAAHYRSADPRAPRIILLDEVFVGVDSDMRAKCMGLLSTFDLDFVMTSEREWGCYPTIAGLAIYQLASRPDIDAVAATRFVWNGRERRRVDVPAPGARARADESVAPTLWSEPGE